MENTAAEPEAETPAGELVCRFRDEEWRLKPALEPISSRPRTANGQPVWSSDAGGGKDVVHLYYAKTKKNWR